MWLAQERQLWASQFLSPRVQKYTHAGTRSITKTGISRERSSAGEQRKWEIRRVEDGFIYFHSFLCLYVRYPRGNAVTEWMVWNLKLYTSFFTVCWFCISCLCEDRGGCCTVTSQNSWSGTCTFCSIWKPIKQFELSPLPVQTAFFQKPVKWVISSLSFDLHCLHDGTQHQIG